MTSRETLHTCLKCGFKTKNITKSNSHARNCKKTPSNATPEPTNQIDKLRKEMTKYIRIIRQHVCPVVYMERWCRYGRKLYYTSCDTGSTGIHLRRFNLYRYRNEDREMRWLEHQFSLENAKKANIQFIEIEEAEEVVAEVEEVVAEVGEVVAEVAEVVAEVAEVAEEEEWEFEEEEAEEEEEEEKVEEIFYGNVDNEIDESQIRDEYPNEAASCISSDSSDEQMRKRKRPSELGGGPTGSPSKRYKRGVDTTNALRSFQSSTHRRRAREKYREQSSIFGKQNACEKTIERCFVKLREGNVDKSVLREMRDARLLLLGHVSIKEYTTILRQHIARIRKLVCRTPSVDVDRVVHDAITPLDMRLMRLDGYSDHNMDKDEMDILRAALNVMTVHPRKFVPLNVSTVYLNSQDYGVVMCKTEDILERVLVNQYGFHSIIYVPWRDSDAGDPYAFYILKYVKNGQRFWDLDSRLEDFSALFSNTLLSYMVKMFKEMYYDLFHDNQYREDYDDDGTQLVTCDFPQLLKNIFSVCCPQTFAWLVCSVIRKHATYRPTPNDLFNFTKEEPSQRRRLKSAEQDMDVINDIVPLLFDDITPEESEEFYKSHRRKQ